MSGYDYGNARLRAKKSQLLAKRELDALAEAGSPQGLISALIKTAYRKSVEAALARASGLDCIAEALRYDLVNTLGAVRAFFTGQAGEMAAIVLRAYDVQNVKAILRGLSKQATTGEILSVLLPIGDLRVGELAELASSPSPRASIDVLATLGSPIARPLLQLRAENPGAGIPEMELALDRWYFQESRLFDGDERPAEELLFSALQLEADIINLLTVLRFAHAPEERRLLREWFDTEELDHLFVGPGKLTFATLARAGSQDTVNAAVEILAGTPYESALNAGLKVYAHSVLLSDFERQLKRLRLAWMSRQISSDPLGIGVLLGYVALKANEIGNIRWIAQGTNLGLNPEAIRAGLEYPA
jgi:V/A-type H+-transporting ATPase subunit C